MNDAEIRAYPKRARLRRRTDFHRVVRRGEVFPGRQALVRRVRNRRGEARVGMATPRGYGKAVRRNRFRRLVREAFRHVRHQLGSYDYLVSPRRHLERPTLAGIRADLLGTLSRRPAPPRTAKGERGPFRRAGGG